MNWLAHLRLAPAAPLVRLGNLCGDFVRGVELDALHPEIVRGVEQHRAVDRFVDAHEVTRRSRRRLLPLRFAAVLVDVFYDHFLARDWDELGDGRPLAVFTAEVYALRESHAALLPPALQRAVPVMRRQDWLLSYREVDGIDAILRRMSRRSRRAAELGDGAAALRANYSGFDSDFRALWPELVQRSPS